MHFDIHQNYNYYVKLQQSSLPDHSNTLHLNIPAAATEFYVLQHVFQQMDRKGVNYVTPTELSEVMEVTKPAISKMLNVLEDKGYIERQQDSKDRRAVYVTLTEKGQGVREESMKIVREAVNRIIRQMGDQAADRLIDALQDLLLAVRQCYPHDRSPREEQE